MQGQKIPEGVRAQIIAAARDNPETTATQVARQFHISKWMVCKIVNATPDVGFPRSRRNVKRANMERIAAVNAASGNVAQAARQLGVSNRAMFETIRGAGIEAKNRESSEAMRERMQRMGRDPEFQLKRRAGILMHWLEIAQERGDSDQVKALLKRASPEVKAAVLEKLREDNAALGDTEAQSVRGTRDVAPTSPPTRKQRHVELRSQP